MPTARFYSFVIASLLFYFFANQTQIGWLYVVSALLAGILVTSLILSRLSLRNIAVRREFHYEQPDSIAHEGDTFSITLRLSRRGNRPLYQVQVQETCPLADREQEDHVLNMFIPVLEGEVSFAYDVTIYRRGLHRFLPLQVRSRAPFGFFERHKQVHLETPILVYPEVRKIKKFSFLDQQPAAQLTNPRAGYGTEVIGVRDYRSGDSPRHIHWRSVARREKLVSKEFAEESQPGVTIVLDRYQPSMLSSMNTKHTPFEMAVKCAVSMADYALRMNYPVYLAADHEGFAAPQGGCVWDTIMQYTARVEPRSVAALGDVLSYQPMQHFIAVALSWPDEGSLEALLSLRQRGYRIFVAVPDPRSFPIETTVSARDFFAKLEQNQLGVRYIQHGEDWAEAISEQNML